MRGSLVPINYVEEWNSFLFCNGNIILHQVENVAFVVMTDIVSSNLEVSRACPY